MTWEFNVDEQVAHIIDWIKGYFVENGPDSKAIVGISGGKDSSVVAALCVRALGKDRVIGVKMPQGVQYDIDYADKLINHLGIESIEVNIGAACGAAPMRGSAAPWKALTPWRCTPPPGCARCGAG